jgi:hypothetical protein
MTEAARLLARIADRQRDKDIRDRRIRKWNERHHPRHEITDNSGATNCYIDGTGSVYQGD